MTDKDSPKWQEIFAKLQKDLRDGVYAQGEPLPSEGALMRKYNVSRITAVRAMNELVKKGLVYRKRGAGTFPTRMARIESGRLGLIMPSLSHGEIFPPICQALMRFAQKDGFSFVFGDTPSDNPVLRAKEACDVARSLVKQGVSGVIFQPLAFLKTPERVTKEIMTLFHKAEIPVVLVDRDIAMRDIPHDFVSIDNFGAGRAIGEHLLDCGAKRICFLMRPNCASVIRARLEGLQSALGEVGRKDRIIVAKPDDTAALRPWFSRRSHPDAVVCESDYVAAQFRNTLLKFKLSVPEDVMLVGFDDVRCAVSATPPLTTVHQSCEDIAMMAYRSLRDRIVEPDIVSRRILLDAPLVVRESTARRGRK